MTDPHNYLIDDKEILDDLSVAQWDIPRFFDSLGKYLPDFLSDDAGILPTVLGDPHGIGKVVAELVIVQLHLGNFL